MTNDEALELEAIRALGRIQPATVPEFTIELRVALPAAGLAPAEKVDEVWAGRILVAFARTEPPLVTNDFDPADVDQHGRVREGAQRLWMLTEAADQREDELERRGG